MIPIYVKRCTLCYAGLALVMSALPAPASEAVNIDVRSKNEPQQHVVTIYAQEGGFGHAYVAFNREDDARHMTTNAVAGFYPPDEKTDPSIGSVRAVFTTKPGKLTDELEKQKSVLNYDLKVAVSVDSDQYARAMKVYSDWQRGGHYFLTLHDCTTFAGEVARSMGLETPIRAFRLHPYDYVREIVDMWKATEATRKEDEARKHAKEAEEQRIEAIRKKRIADHAAGDLAAREQHARARAQGMPRPGPALYHDPAGPPSGSIRPIMPLPQPKPAASMTPAAIHPPVGVAPAVPVDQVPSVPSAVPSINQPSGPAIRRP